MGLVMREVRGRVRPEDVKELLGKKIARCLSKAPA
jgi:Asp-tRNA(Asn)/Glu-tRNA(Gln) amidotransferase B subunit